MKITHIIVLVICAVAIGVIISTASDASTYVEFRTAKEMAANGDDDKVHVVGSLPKNKNGEVTGLIYDPIIDPNHFEFTLIDNDTVSNTVVYKSAKPQDFEKSEKVVVVGKMQGEVFIADQILMKCPSKYEEKEVKAEK